MAARKDTYDSTYGAGKDYWDRQANSDAAKRLRKFAGRQAEQKKGGKR